MLRLLMRSPGNLLKIAALWTADSDRVVAAFDPFVIALLHPVGPVVAPVLSPRHPRGLRETSERTDD